MARPCRSLIFTGAAILGAALLATAATSADAQVIGAGEAVTSTIMSGTWTGRWIDASEAVNQEMARAESACEVSSDSIRFTLTKSGKLYLNLTYRHSDGDVHDDYGQSKLTKITVDKISYLVRWQSLEHPSDPNSIIFGTGYLQVEFRPGVWLPIQAIAGDLVKAAAVTQTYSQYGNGDGNGRVSVVAKMASANTIFGWCDSLLNK